MAGTRGVTTRAMVALASTALLVGCTGQTSESIADYPGYSTSGDLLHAADVIVRGTAVRARVERQYPDVSTSGDPLRNPQAGLSDDEARAAREDAAVVVTVSSVRVVDVLKGDVKVGETVEVSQLGGTLDGVEHREAHTTMLPTDGRDFVLLLADFGPGRPYSLLNPEQAMYEVHGDDPLTSVNGATDAPLADKSIKDLKAELATQRG